MEKRAAALMLTMGKVCDQAGVAHSTWSRAKARGKVRVTTLKSIEDVLDAAEAKAARGRA